MGATWVPFVELVGIIGEESAIALCAKFGGVDIYVPKSPNQELIELIGCAAAALCMEYPGMDIMLPNVVNRPVTKKEIIVGMVAKLRADGLDPNSRQIAMMLGCTKRHVDGVLGDTTDPKEKIRMRIRRSKNFGVHRLPICVMEANGVRE